jgi:uncharacterized membrane-anchored protein YjiN (DUF445 family)
MTTEKKSVSSYEKGILKLLERREGFEWIIAEYVIDTNIKFKSNVFPTTQIAKIIMNKLAKKKTQYPILHKIVREIFKIWQKEDICETVSGGISNAKKTKRVYQISDYGISMLRSKIIGFNIQKIQGKITEEFEPTIRSRDDILRTYLNDLLDQLGDISDGHEEDDDDQDADEEDDEDSE